MYELTVNVFVVLFLASCSLGGAWQSIDATSEYLKDRVAFGEPLANFQVIKISTTSGSIK